MSIVNLFVTVSSEPGARVADERRFDKGLTLTALKARLELFVGTSPDHMKLQLFDQRDRFVCDLNDDTKMLGAYPVENYMRLHVIDTNPHRRVGEFSDLESVPKYEMPDEEYAKLSDSVRAFKERNKLGRFADVPPDKDEEYQAEAALMQPGTRCECDVTGSGELKIRGVVRFVGKTQFSLGYWVGVQLDEPMGKNNGLVQGVQYFACPDKYGLFVRPDRIQVGDFPEEDFEM